MRWRSASELEAHPLWAAPKEVRRVELSRAFLVSLLVVLLLTLLNAVWLVTIAGGQLRPW